MPTIEYEAWNPTGETLLIVHSAVQIAEDYAAQGYDLTLRQLYYQFVSRDIIPNTEKSYKRLGNIVNQARLSGYLDWDRITDRTRNLQRLPSWDDPADIIGAVARQFKVPLWVDQPTYVEVWVEKEALAGVVQRAADQYDVPWFSCRGYVSQSEMWSASQRLRGRIEDGKYVTIIHLGDHDPSGIDMTRDITDRLKKFIYSDFTDRWGYGTGADLDSGEVDVWDIERQVMDSLEETDIDEISYAVDTPIEIRRIALNMDQVRQYSPPPNPAKITDSRAEGYIERFGAQSWELDALDPATLNALITDTIGEYIHWDLFEARQALIPQGRDLLTRTSNRWADVVDLVSNEGDSND